MRRLTAQQKEALPLLREAKSMVKGSYATAIQKAIDLIEGNESAQLTNLNFDAVPVGGELLDPKHPGLLLKNGARTGKRWFFRTSKIAGTTRVEILIGPYPQVSIEEARKMRLEMAQTRSGGKMPTSPMLTPSGNTTYTVGALFDWYEREYCRTKRASSALDDHKVIKKHIRPAWNDLPLEDWTAEKIDALVQSLFNATTKGRQAQKVRTVISTANNAARGYSKRWTTPIPMVKGIPNPMTEVRQLPDRSKIPGKRRENYKPKLPEMIAFTAALSERVIDETIAQCLLLQVYTCARINEVAELPWSEIDLDEGVWTLPVDRAKNATEHLVPLSRQAIDLLHKRRKADPSGTWVFPHKGDALSRDRATKILAANRHALGVTERFTSHAIRHACLSWCATNQIGREIRDRISNHKPPAGTDNEYVEAELTEPAARALQRWADAVTGIKGEVINLGARA